MKSISTLSKSRFVNSPSQKTQISPPTKTNLSNSSFQVHNHPSTPRIPPIQHTFTTTKQNPQHPPPHPPNSHMQTIQSPNPFPNPPKPKPNPTKQHRIPTQHPIFQKTQKNQKSKIKQTNIPMIQKHNPTSKKFTKSQSLSNLSEENLRTYFTLCKNQQSEREAKQKKKKNKNKNKKKP